MANAYEFEPIAGLHEPLSRPICFICPVSFMCCRNKPDAFFVTYWKKFQILVTSSWIVSHTMCWNCIMIIIQGIHNYWKIIYLVTPTQIFHGITQKQVIKLNCWKKEYVCDKKVLKYNYNRQWRQAEKFM